MASPGASNQEGKDAVRRVLRGGSSGRVAVLLIAAAFLALGIYGGSLVLSVASAIAVVLAAWALVRAALVRREDRRLQK
jgi:hypothetical protein